MWNIIQLITKNKTMERKYFTTEEGIAIQTRQLNEWQTKLKPKVFTALKKFAVAKNPKAYSGFDVVRGSELTTFIMNYKPQ